MSAAGTPPQDGRHAAPAGGTGGEGPGPQVKATAPPRRDPDASASKPHAPQTAPERDRPAPRTDAAPPPPAPDPEDGPQADAAQTGPCRIIATRACVAEGADWLAAREPRFAAALARTGPLPLRRRADGFEALLSAIVSQQVSVAAGAAIWGRLRAARLTGPRKIAAASDADLRACGLSRQKIRYARALADARLPYARLRAAPTEEVVATLVAVPGIGRWTAEIYALFALGHADAFAPGDLALQEAARLLYGLQARPSEKALREMAAPWSPWRGVAARLLWSYYRVAKNREGVR